VTARWSINEVGGEFEVYQGSRRKRVWPTLEAAVRWLRGKVIKGEKVYLVEPDGYRVDITRRHFHI
jgi:hypothetical protein